MESILVRKERPINIKSGAWELTIWPFNTDTKRPNCYFTRGRQNKATKEWDNIKSFNFFETEIEKIAEMIQKYYDMKAESETETRRKK